MYGSAQKTNVEILLIFFHMGGGRRRILSLEDISWSSTSKIFFFVAASLAVVALAGPIYNVVDNGAVGDGITNDTDAIWQTWKKACSDSGSPTVLFPSGKTFLLSKVILKGPCNSSMHLQVDGVVMAPNYRWVNVSADVSHWMSIKRVDGLAIDGKGQINGNGQPWWDYKNNVNVCAPAPDGLAIYHSSNVSITELNFIDSGMKHITLDYTVGIHISHLNISAPGTSPNTDGIHIESCQHVEIVDSIIGTGDDCISIGNGTYDLNISRIDCGPGHGISVGSLGRNESEATVGQIHVSDCLIHNTTNGVRIKTWPGRSSGFAKDITFERISFTAVENPIILDQYYCDQNCHACPEGSSSLEVGNIHYGELYGTSVGPFPFAITFNCSSLVGCSGIHMNNVGFQSIDGGTAAAFCANANGTIQGSVVPAVKCF